MAELAERSREQGINAHTTFATPAWTPSEAEVGVPDHPCRRSLLRTAATRGFPSLSLAKILSACRINSLQQYESAPRFLNRDAKYGTEVLTAIRSMKIQCVRTSFESSWQNEIAERWVESCRRDLLDHVVPWTRAT
jgi:putative transposase